jgi:hypothetical protein
MLKSGLPNLRSERLREARGIGQGEAGEFAELFEKFGAGDGTRTHDVQLGKLTVD